MTNFESIKLGDYFRVPGYDDLFQKITEDKARDLGCGWLNRPTRLARKGSVLIMLDFIKKHGLVCEA